MTVPATVTLTVVQGRLEPGEYVLDERTTRILGRAADCDPRLPDDERHRTVSRHHCLLDVNPPLARIRDFGSLNGTYVNGAKIGQRRAHQTPADAALGTFPEHDLRDGDEIRVGDTVFRVGIRRATGWPATRVLVRCGGCGRELPEAEADAGEAPDGYVCDACRTEPAAVLGALVEAADSGRGDLAPIAGYRLLRELGRGGMGAVHLARHGAGGREVALKVMLPRTAAGARARARFLREVELTRSLRHPNIAALYEAGYADGTFFFTMEYCPGGSLDERIDAMPPTEAVRVALQVLDGLDHAHGRGVVHRDLSPANILLTEDDTAGLPRVVAKVADFGLAKAFDQAGLSGLTRTGTTAGKPWYVPRTQVVNFRDAAPAVDVWALAAVLYRALSGTYPRDFPPGRDPWHVVLRDRPVPLRVRAPGIARDLAEAVDEALREEPGAGFATAAEFGYALRGCRDADGGD